MKSDYFYSKTTGLYVSRKPLAIDARVKDAGEKARLKIEWDDEGRINSIDFDDSKKLLGALGARMLNPVEYWQVVKDAMEQKDLDMVTELMSNKYAEWLDRVYLEGKTFIDNPELTEHYKYDGEKKKGKFPEGRPGWFNPENNIDPETGEPINVELNREKFATSWKFWSPDHSVTELGACVPIRGYVTSVGKPSLDLGIPVDARQPKVMIRECRYQPRTPVIDEKILGQAEDIVSSKNADKARQFIEKYGGLFAKSDDSLVYKLRENFLDLLGSIALKQNVTKASAELTPVAGNEKSKELSYESFADFISKSQQRLEEALANNKDLVFVMGHKNPDTDTVVTSLFEAWRNHLVKGDRVNYVPIVQSTRLPDEIKQLLGGLSDKVLLTDNPFYKKAKESGLARWISVDQNRDAEVQKYFVTIIDHHVVSEVAKNRDIPKTLEMTGSCTALVTRKYLGMGFDFDEGLSKILHGAALMDTENRVEHKMTEQDAMIMDYLKQRSGVNADNEFYQELMSHLLNTDFAEHLFKRDYKEDWGFGFAVAKMKNAFSKQGELLKQSTVSELHELAVQNNIQKNLPLTLLRITDYEENNETVNRERVYVLFNKDATKEFKEKTAQVLESIIRFEFPRDHVNKGPDFIDFWGTGMQLSRKKTAPVLEPVVAAFNSYFYSPTIDKWVKRDFLHNTQLVKEAFPGLSTDESGRVNYINYPDAKELAKRLGIGMLSLNEYWKALHDAKNIKDLQMINSLQGSNFVEFLDSAIVNKGYLTDHPEIINGIAYGTGRKIVVPQGKPGLIHPDDVDLETGLPREVRRPNEYGNPELWRYWEPDANLVVPCRSYIFVIDQPCWDGKFHLHDSFPNLGLRPVVDKPEQPGILMSWDDDFLTVKIGLEKEERVYKWPKRISDFE